MCPQPDRKTVQIPQCGAKQPNFTRTVAGEEIAMLLVPRARPLFRRSSDQPGDNVDGQSEDHDIKEKS
jgi:hypothetical protein